jgi:hypothetical protein
MLLVTDSVLAVTHGDIRTPLSIASDETPRVEEKALLTHIR